MSDPALPSSDTDAVVRSLAQLIAASGLARDVAIKSVDTRSGLRCQRCGISDAVAGIRFDDQGICTECSRFERYRERLDPYFSDRAQLRALVEANRPKKRSDTDCLLLFSGGKDSTYVLHQLVNMGLKVATFTFDNGFISRKAFENIEQITRQLDIEHINGTHADMKTVFRESLQRHSTVCKGCFKALLDLSLAHADQRGINLIFTGLSRGQIVEERLKFFYDRNIFDPAIIEQKLAEGRRVYHQAERYKGLDGHAFRESDLFDRVQLIDYFRYEDVTKKEIYGYLRESNQGWEEPTDTGFCSSNCMINDVGVAVHRSERGYSNYEVPTSWEVRLGHLSREDALKELSEPPDDERVGKMMRAIDYAPPVGKEPKQRADVYCVLEQGVDLAQVEAVANAAFPSRRIEMRFFRADRIARNAQGQALAHVVDEPARSFRKKTPADVPAMSRLQRRLLDAGHGRDLWRVEVIPASGVIDQNIFRRALLQVITRHSALRLRRSGGEGEVPATAPVAAKLPLSLVDLGGRNETERPILVSRLAGAMRAKVVANTEGELAFFAVATPDARGASSLVVAVHAAVMDDFSWSVLLNDLERAYRAYAAGTPAVLGAQVGFRDAGSNLAAWAYAPLRAGGRPAASLHVKGASGVTALSVVEEIAERVALPCAILVTNWAGRGGAIGHFCQPHSDSQPSAPAVVLVADDGGATQGSLLSFPGPTDLAVAGGRSWAVVSTGLDGMHLRWSSGPEDTDDRLLDAAIRATASTWSATPVAETGTRA